MKTEEIIEKHESSMFKAQDCILMGLGKLFIQGEISSQRQIKVEKLVKHLIAGELDFLYRNPEDFDDLYDDLTI